jgi:hypothetical protein
MVSTVAGTGGRTNAAGLAAYIAADTATATMIAILAKKVLELFTMLMVAASAAAYNRLLVLTG